MVKLKGPGLAHHAAGGLGETLIFAQSKGRAYAKRWHKPANPNTLAQQSVRSLTRLISSAWANFTSAQKDSWNALAAQTNVSPFNACLTFNLSTWGTFLYPTKQYPPTRVGAYAGFGSITVVQQGRGALWTFPVTIPDEGWALAIHNVPTSGGAATRLNCIQFLIADTVGTHTWLWSPLNPGTYYFRAVVTSIDGNPALPGGNRSVTIT